MRIFALAAVAVCTLYTNVAPATPTYLDTETIPHPAQTELLKAATGFAKPSAEETLALVESYSNSDQFAAIIERYTNDLFKILKIDPKKSKQWIAKNKELYQGIRNYVGDSGEGERDEIISWQSINGKLRSKEPMNDGEKKFYREILRSIELLPRVKGLVFRGVRMNKARYDGLIEGSVWHQAAFTSTSLSFAVAAGFGYGAPPDRTGVLIIKTKGGAPVSPLTFDGGFRGQPGRIFEREVLLTSGQDLIVRHKVEDTANNRYYIFLEHR